MKQTILILIIAALGATSCTSTKHIYKITDNKDSLYAEKLKDSLHMVITERENFEARVRELENQEVSFDTTPCPEIKEIDCPGLNTDSVNAIIRKLNLLYSGAMNKVKVLADGSIEAEGRIGSYRRQKENDALIIASKDREIDSLKTALSEKTVKVSTASTEVDKHKKNSFFNFWWLLAIGVVIGWVLRGKLKILNMRKNISILLLSVSLMGCGRYSDGTSVWAGGAWALLVITILPAMYFLFTAWRQSKSGSSKQTPGKGTVYSDKNVPIYQMPFFWFGVALLAAAVVIILVQNAEK